MIHVFETFSLGSEIDSFLEKVDERKKALPEEALAAYKKLNELSNKYYIETWGAEIVSYGKDINTAIGNEDYETLAAKAEACKELEEEIISANYRFGTELESVRDTLIDMRSSTPSYALFKDDADDLIEDINNTLSSDIKAQFPYYVDRGNEMIERIEEANGSFAVVNDRKEYYDELFEQLEITDRDRYNELQLEYSSALSGGSDAERLSEIVDELADFYEETYSDNYEEFERLLSKIDNFDPSRLTADEYEVFSAAYEEMHEAANSDDVARMLQKVRLCEEYVNLYIQKITECDRFMTLAERLASDFFFEYGYDDQLDEEEVCFICENVLTPELKDELKNTLGWGEESESEEAGLWTCGFSRSECEDLAYFITGQKHYFYQDISDYSEKMFVPENTGTVRKGDVRVTENDDGSLDLDYDIQAFYDGFVYSIHVTINAVYNEDSFFDHYSVASIEMNDYVYLDYYSVYRKAIEELVSYEPDHYTEDQFGRHLSFAYIDDDYIPELYITSVYGYACAYLVTFVDNDTYRITQLASGDGFNEYIPGEGVIRVCDGRQGYYVDEVIRIRDDGYTEVVFSGENSYVDFDSEEKRYDVTIPENLEDTDATTYYGYLDDIYTSKGESYYLTGDYTLSMMLDMLDEIINYVATY